MNKVLKFVLAVPAFFIGKHLYEEYSKKSKDSSENSETKKTDESTDSKSN